MVDSELESNAVNSPDQHVRPVVEQVAAPSPPGNRLLWPARILLVLFALFSILSVAGIWARDQVLETDAFVQTMSPLARHPDIQVGVSNAVSDAVVEELSSVDLFDSDNPAADLLAVPVRQAIANISAEITLTILESDQFGTLWDSVTRSGHEAMVLVLTGEQSDLIVSEEGQVALDLSPVVEEVRSALSEQGIDLPQRQSGEELDLQIVVFESDDLGTLQRLVEILDNFAFFMPILALIMLGGYFAASRDRWAAGVNSALAFGMAMIILLILIAIVRWVYLRNLNEDINSDTARAFYDVLTDLLRTATRVLGIGGFLLAGIVAIARPKQELETGKMVSARDYIGSTHDTVVRRWPAVAEAESHVGRRKALAIGIFLAVIGLMLTSWDNLEAAALVVFGIIALVGSLAIWFIPVPTEVRVVDLIETDSLPEPTTLDQPDSRTDTQAGRDTAQQLGELSDLRREDLLTTEEFETAKQRILGSNE